MSKNNKTADVVIEIGCEELPAAELYQLIDDFASLLGTELTKEHLTFSSISKFATPRRLALIIQELQTSQSDREVSRRGPSVKAAYDGDGKPTQAVIGFAQSCGVNIEELTNISTDKGEYLSAKITEKGRHINQLLPPMLNSILPKLSKNRTMRWDVNNDRSIQFVRPIRWLMALVDKQVLEWEMFGLQATNQTFAHRFYSDKPLSIAHANEYEDTLAKQGYVVASATKRKQIISEWIERLTKESGCSVSPAFTEDFLDELAAITEYPVGYLGEFDKEFLELPPEVLDSVLILKQYYIPLVDAKGKTSTKFIFIANIDSQDAQLLIEGNQAVVRPRLADASFFYQQDKSQTLEDRFKHLDKITFVEGLGSIENKAYRCHDLAKYLSDTLAWQDVAESSALAAKLGKCDLTSLMVQEFPELQGVMGKYYLREDYTNDDKSLDKQVIEQASVAIEEHYLPRHAGDKIAPSKAGKVVAMADRIDTLVGLFYAGYKPTSEKDPYALRRTALGLVRTIIESEIFVDLRGLAKESVKCYKKHNKINIPETNIDDVLTFINERVHAYGKGNGKENGFASDVLDAVFYSQQNDLYDAWLKVQAIHSNFTKNISSLVGVNKRLKNILDKHSCELAQAEVNQELFESEYEQKVFATLQEIQQDFDQACATKEYAKCLELLSGLSSPLEEFFNQVMVIVEDKQLRENRLLLLHKTHKSFLRLADFSRLTI